MATTINNVIIDPKIPTPGVPGTTTPPKDDGLFGTTPTVNDNTDAFVPKATKGNSNPQNMEDFEDIMSDENGYETYTLDSPSYRYNYEQYQDAKKLYGNDLSFRAYLQQLNIGMPDVLQRIENYMETGNENIGDDKKQNLLSEQRSYMNPDDPNQEIYWNEDKTKYYMIDWNTGEYRSVDPKKPPFFPPQPPIKDKDESAQPVPDLPPTDPGFKDDDLETLNKLDPIGYKDKDGNSFDFVIDRNNDGVFNGPSEFLGALDNWDEMEKLDKDGNGIVEGSELSGLKLLKTGKNGVQSFIDAIALNIKIYLDSYFKADKDAKDENDQTLLGNFTISADGETHRGYNTLDSMDYLNEKYGNMFNNKLA